jgi:hypothetical protein
VRAYVYRGKCLYVYEYLYLYCVSKKIYKTVYLIKRYHTIYMFYTKFDPPKIYFSHQLSYLYLQPNPVTPLHSAAHVHEIWNRTKYCSHVPATFHRTAAIWSFHRTAASVVSLLNYRIIYFLSLLIIYFNLIKLSSTPDR